MFVSLIVFRESFPLMRPIKLVVSIIVSIVLIGPVNPRKSLWMLSAFFSRDSFPNQIEPDHDLFKIKKDKSRLKKNNQKCWNNTTNQIIIIFEEIHFT